MTALIDARGRLIDVAPQFESYVLSGEVEPRQGATPYVMIGNRGFLLLTVGLMLLGWVWHRGGQRGAAE